MAREKLPNGKHADFGVTVEDAGTTPGEPNLPAVATGQL